MSKLERTTSRPQGFSPTRKGGVHVGPPPFRRRLPPANLAPTAKITQKRPCRVHLRSTRPKPPMPLAPQERGGLPTGHWHRLLKFVGTPRPSGVLSKNSGTTNKTNTKRDFRSFASRRLIPRNPYKTIWIFTTLQLPNQTPMGQLQE